MTLTDAYGNPRRPARFSQCEKIMRVLRDERWHTAAEIHQIAGFSRLNSRISELRKRGYLIEHETTGVGAAGSRYRLVQASTEEPSGDPHPVASASPSPEEPPCEATTGALSSVEQLELVA